MKKYKWCFGTVRGWIDSTERGPIDSDIWRAIGNAPDGFCHVFVYLRGDLIISGDARGPLRAFGKKYASRFTKEKWEPFSSHEPDVQAYLAVRDFDDGSDKRKKLGRKLGRLILKDLRSRQCEQSE